LPLLITDVTRSQSEQHPIKLTSDLGAKYLTLGWRELRVGMTLKQELRRQERAVLCRSDLEQIRDALRQVRASCPTSVLADMAEQKFQSIEPGS
jgi:hypothetical protein